MRIDYRRTYPAAIQAMSKLEQLGFERAGVHLSLIHISEPTRPY